MLVVAHNTQNIDVLPVALVPEAGIHGRIASRRHNACIGIGEAIIGCTAKRISDHTTRASDANVNLKDIVILDNDTDYNAKELKRYFRVFAQRKKSSRYRNFA